MRDEPARELRPLPAEQVEHHVEVRARAGATIDEGADHPELLGEDEERREGRRPGEGAEQADGAARTRGRDGGVERVGLAADRLDDEVDRRLQRVAEDTTRLAVAHHAVGTERQRCRALLRPAGDDEDLAAPPARAATTAMRPIVPAPSTSTRSPIARPASRTACTATPSGSASAAVAKSTPAGTRKQ